MNNRLTIQDLAVLLAEHTGKDRSTTERFLREFVAVVSEGVFADKLVKVKGLGSFKIVAVEKRESIHVNTGERFLIPEHSKFSFLPDKDLRELVNKPFSFFETTELSDSTDFSELDVSEEAETDEKETDDESVVEEVAAPQSVPAEPELEPEPEEHQPDVRPQSVEASEPPRLHMKGKRERRRAFRKRTNRQIIFIVALLAVANTVLFLTRDLFFERENPQQAIVLTATDTVAVPVETTPPQDTLSRDTVAGAYLEPSSQPERREEVSDVVDSIKIKAGDRLTRIALHYYGNKHFWVYLYEYNKTKIKDPNNVPVGTVIEIPAPRLYRIDAHDRASVEKAAARQTEILSGK